MSNRSLFLQTRQELRSSPTLYFSRGICLVLIVWSQDLLPWIGALSASMLFLLTLHSMKKPWHPPRWGRVLFLAAATFPTMFLWRVLSSWVTNTDWLILNSKLWALSAIFFLFLAHSASAFAMEEIDQGENLDTWVSLVFKRMLGVFRPMVIASLLISIPTLLLIEGGGFGLLILAPIALAFQGSLSRSAPAVDAGDRT